MSTQTVTAEVAAFVDAVRAQLDDLAPDVVEDLTDGLGADVGESLLEPGGQLPDPAVYAAELRAAADLPPRRTGADGPDVRSNARRLWRGARRLAATRGERPWWRLAREYAAIGAPLWWVLRGWAVTALLVRVLDDRWPPAVPDGYAATATLLAVVGLSVEAGRRARDRRWNWLRAGLIPVNLLVLAALPVVLTHVRTGETVHVYSFQESPPAQGLWLEGTEVRNIYPYDAAGRPLEGVQLWTDNRQPLRVGRSASQPVDDSRGRTVAQLPSFDLAGQPLWNVYPLRQWVRTDENGEEVSGPATTEPATRPQVSLPPLPTLVTSPAPASPAPSAGPSANLSAIASQPGSGPTP
jgi:hypothetical protein